MTQAAGPGCEAGGFKCYWVTLLHGLMWAAGACFESGGFTAAGDVVSCDWLTQTAGAIGEVGGFDAT